jgi:hypothetical protein
MGDDKLRTSSLATAILDIGTPMDRHAVCGGRA